MTDEFAEIREAFALESAEMLAEMESALLVLELSLIHISEPTRHG